MDLVEYATKMSRAAKRINGSMLTAVTDYAQTLEGEIKARQGTPPAPNVITGDYQGSWSHNATQAGEIVEAVVGTNKPQARRLEFGFVGPDRLGRVYHQAPRPHVAPAIEATTKAWGKTWRGVIVDALK